MYLRYQRPLTLVLAFNINGVFLTTTAPRHRELVLICLEVHWHEVRLRRATQGAFEEEERDLQIWNPGIRARFNIAGV